MAKTFTREDYKLYHFTKQVTTLNNLRKILEMVEDYSGYLVEVCAPIFTVDKSRDEIIDFIKYQIKQYEEIVNSYHDENDSDFHYSGGINGG